MIMIFLITMRFLKPIDDLLWTLSIELILLLTQYILLKIGRKKLEKREQVSIDSDEKQDGVRAENNLMKCVKVKSQFLEEVKKNRKRLKISYAERVKSRM